MLQLAHPEVAQPKPGALRPQVCHYSFAEPKLAPESFAERTLLFRRRGFVYIKGKVCLTARPRKQKVRLLGVSNPICLCL